MLLLSGEAWIAKAAWWKQHLGAIRIIVKKCLCRTVKMHAKPLPIGRYKKASLLARAKALHLGEATKAALAKLGARQALHAARLGFEHPITGEELEFESALPPELAALEEALRIDSGRS